MFAPSESSDQPRELLLAELVREAVIRRTFQEVPHAVEVVIEEVEHPRAGLARVRALIWVESASQKGIVVGAGGRMIKAIGTAARAELERELGCQVHLDLSVRVRRDWRADEGLLDRLGMGCRERALGATSRAGATALQRSASRSADRPDGVEVELHREHERHRCASRPRAAQACDLVVLDACALVHGLGGAPRRAPHRGVPCPRGPARPGARSAPSRQRQSGVAASR